MHKSSKGDLNAFITIDLTSFFKNQNNQSILKDQKEGFVNEVVRLLSTLIRPNQLPNGFKEKLLEQLRSAQVDLSQMAISNLVHPTHTSDTSPSQSTQQRQRSRSPRR